MIYWSQNTADIQLLIYTIFAAVQAEEPQNLALQKPVWSSTNDTSYRASYAVDGNPTTHGSEYMTTFVSSWPFLAIDLGQRMTLESIALWLAGGKCQFVGFSKILPVDTIKSCVAYCFDRSRNDIMEE